MRGGGGGGGDDRGHVRGALHSHVEAHGAPPSPLRVKLHPLGPLEPFVGVVVGVDEGGAHALGESLVLLLPDLVLLARVDVGVVEEDGHVVARGNCHQGDCGRLSGIAGHVGER